MRAPYHGCTAVFTLMFAVAMGCAPSGAPEPPPSGETAEPSTAAAPDTGARMSSTTLESTHWTLLDVGGRPASGTADNVPDLRLNAAEKQAGGSTGCNRFFGPYTLSGDSLRFGNLASTMRACLEPDVGEQEGAFLKALGATRTWRISGDTLVLTGDAGPVARFAAQKPT